MSSSLSGIYIVVAEATGTISSGVDNPVAGANLSLIRLDFIRRCRKRGGGRCRISAFRERFLAVSLVRFRLMTVALLHRAARSGHRGCGAAKSERAERPERTHRNGFI